MLMSNVSYGVCSLVFTIISSLGIYINSKPDGNERYTFALITERATDVFAFETEEMMKSWGNLLQERLGRGTQVEYVCIFVMITEFSLVLIVNITIPYRQHQLKQGLAMLILRDNAIAITTTDQPPKFQCSFLIPHIKKYGDFDDGFVFETGNRCPKGEKTFLIRCADNKKLYSLLDSLANRSMTIRDVILKNKFNEIVISQGPLPKAPMIPHSHSPSFDFGKLPSQFRGKRHKLRSTSDLPDKSARHKALGTAQGSLSYYNMESAQESYQNVTADGQCIVPEVEYEIIPEDLPTVGDKTK